MPKMMQIRQEHIFWIFFAIFVFSQNVFKNRIKNWVATDAFLYNAYEIKSH
jgi:hypothetical protein